MMMNDEKRASVQVAVRYGIRRGAIAARSPGSQVQIPLMTRMSVSCVCCVVSGICDELINLSEESYRLRVSVLGHAVGQLVETLRTKPEGRGFVYRWCHWNFSLT